MVLYHSFTPSLPTTDRSIADYFAKCTIACQTWQIPKCSKTY